MLPNGLKGDDAIARCKLNQSSSKHFNWTIASQEQAMLILSLVVTHVSAAGV